jgi:hypothetical protein
MLALYVHSCKFESSRIGSWIQKPPLPPWQVCICMYMYMYMYMYNVSNYQPNAAFQLT